MYRKYFCCRTNHTTSCSAASTLAHHNQFFLPFSSFLPLCIARSETEFGFRAEQVSILDTSHSPEVNFKGRELIDLGFSIEEDGLAHSVVGIGHDDACSFTV
ncbi:hypothetical protein HBH56_198240 [Parastagonospora nodorum]|uniref:Uncharacterized protein n=1 Tax=Phaeosphaeria nodorum (strain SN15 / ATCC MYA-4574 / FGSC 10173) TaxID=321614 RepID=A0A7U2F3A0_PHANO|nr:hypothetical protein HBH56_198240 [Parastagonospora nodorum]QRC97671.1 hypothetical protein JI435_435070 [Parastagonospora nodorum SN15]KAH3924573.1 hypothetical protein HBH54_191200 [Parastagonospora nodorum]KAH3941915.1 hypothetical protein HBH53_194130 [Parastagonospora nodorum]KAH4002621.1 hypothetical protein HBI10_076640 [Parastagonospora nodorum]